MSSFLRHSDFSATASVSGRLIFRELTPQWKPLLLQQIRDQLGITQTLAPPSERQPMAAVTENALVAESVTELKEMSRQFPASFVFAEFSPQHYRELASRIPRLRRTLPSLRIAVVCFDLPRMSIAEYEAFDAVFREAGASAVISNHRELLATIPAIIKHFSSL